MKNFVSVWQPKAHRHLHSYTLLYHRVPLLLHPKAVSEQCKDDWHNPAHTPSQRPSSQRKRARPDPEQSFLVCQCWHGKRVCCTGISHQKQTSTSVLSPSSQQTGTVHSTHSSSLCKKKCYMTTGTLNAPPGLPRQTFEKRKIFGDVPFTLNLHTLQNILSELSQLRK